MLNNYAHVIAVAESGDLTERDTHASGLVSIFSTQRDLSVHARGDNTTIMTKLHEVLLYDQDLFNAMIVEVTFGSSGNDPSTRVEVLRAGRSSFKVAVYHVRNTAKDKLQTLREQWRVFISALHEYQVDWIAGDANLAAHRYCKAQRVNDPNNGSIPVMMRQFMLEMNEDTPIAKRVVIEQIDNTPPENVLANKDYDCCLAYLIHWGKTPYGEDLREKITEAVNKGQQSVKDYDHALNQDAPYHEGPLDWTWNRSDRIMRYVNADLFLSEQDQAWHHPILMTLRQCNERNKIQRTEAAKARRSKRRQERRRRNQELEVSSWWTGQREWTWQDWTSQGWSNWSDWGNPGGWTAGGWTAAAANGLVASCRFHQ